MRLTAFSLLAILPMTLTGCSGGSSITWPELVPTKGTVTQGGQPVNGGLLSLQVTSEGTTVIVGSVVKPDGSFTLMTSHVDDKSGTRKEGAPAGSYKVTFTPNLGDQTAGGNVQPVTLTQPITISKPTTDLKIELPAKKK